MKLLFTLLFLIVPLGLIKAQNTTSYDADFASGYPFVNVYDWASNQIKCTVANGQLEVIYEKAPDLMWNRLVFWVKPFDIHFVPFCSFKIKGDKNFEMIIDFKDETDVTVTKTFNVTTAWQEVSLDLTGDLATFGSNILAEMQWDVGSANASGFFYIDDFKMGLAAEPDYNLPPLVDEITNKQAFVENKIQTIDITGLSDGNFKLVQNLTLSASTSNDALFSSFEIVYDPTLDPTTAQLSFLPAGDTGTAMVTLILTDDGSTTNPGDDNETTISFQLRLVDIFNGFTESFDVPLVPPGWTNDETYALSIENQKLKVVANKAINQHATSFQLNFDIVHNFSEAPWMTIDAESSKSFACYFFLFDEAGMAVRGQEKVFEGSPENKIFIDFSGSSWVDYTKIKAFRINMALENSDFSGTAWFDNLKLGTAAEKRVTLLRQTPVEVYKNQTQVKRLFTNIKNSASIQVSARQGKLINSVVSEIQNQTSTITFDCLEGAEGKDTLDILAIGNPGFLEDSTWIPVTIETNQPPVFDPLASMVTHVNAGSLNIKITGISDNNPSVEQELIVSAQLKNDTVASLGTIAYLPGGTIASIPIDIIGDGVDTLIVTLSETSTPPISFSDTMIISVFNEINQKPTCIVPVKIQAAENSGVQQIVLLVTDGDVGLQSLTYNISSSNTNIVEPIEILTKTNDTLIVAYYAKSAGTALLSLTITDDGGNSRNNGNQYLTVTIPVTLVVPPANTYIVDFSDVEGDKARNLWTAGGMYSFSQVDSSANGFYGMRVDATNKSYWDGSNLNFNVEGLELDLSEYPYMSMEIYPISKNTLHWLWFYDFSNHRNDQNNKSKEMWAQAGKWNNVYFDFSGPNDWKSGETGTDINTTRISRVLFDMHNAVFTWPPPPNYTGSFLIRNMRFGKAAVLPKIPQSPTMDPLGAMLFFENSGAHEVYLTGIHDGKGSSANMQISVTSSTPAYIEISAQPQITPEGKATIPINVRSAGKSKLTITLSGGTSEENYVADIWMNVLSSSVEIASSFNIDPSQKKQKIYGFGTYWDKDFGDLYTREMQASAVRIGLIGNQIEWTNDNNDPYVLNMEGFDYNAFDWDYFRKLKAGGVETFILTSWSPPAWMKENLAESNNGPAVGINSDDTWNRLAYYYYEEFAESMVAVVKMFKEESDIDITAIGLQNEPVFHEPYPSAILDPSHFVELIKVVGKRFEKEGIKTRLYMPEQVYSQGTNSIDNYIDKLQLDPEAEKYCDIVAVHGYESSGVSFGSPDFTSWTNLKNNAISGPNPKEMWMTETYIEYKSFQDAMSIAGALQGALIYGNVGLWTQWSFRDQFTKNGQPNSLLYAMKNFAGFIRPGSVRIASSGNNNSIQVSAFENADSGTYTIVIVNLDTRDVTMNLSAPNMPSVYKTYRTTESENTLFLGETDIRNLVLLPGKSIVTLYAHKTSNLTLNKIEDLVLNQNPGEQSITLTGISDGAGDISGLSLEVQNNNEPITGNISISPIQTDGTATLIFTPGEATFGTAKVIVRLTDGDQEQFETFYVVIRKAVSVDNHANQNIVVYPNPAKQELFFNQEIAGIEILTVSGVTVLKNKDLNSNRLNISYLKPGFYLAKLTLPNNESITSFFVVN